LSTQQARGGYGLPDAGEYNCWPLAGKFVFLFIFTLPKQHLFADWGD
jgi:hypothetical protein